MGIEDACGVREVAWLRGNLPTNPALSVPQLHPMRMEQRMPLILEVKNFSPSSLRLFLPLFVRGTCKRPPRTLHHPIPSSSPLRTWW